jgi:hypothetical protein
MCGERVSRRRWLAAPIVAALAIIVAAIAVGVGFIVIPYQTPGSESVPLTVVARSGPPADMRFGSGTGVSGTEAILASTSLADLSTLALALSRRPDSCPNGNCWSAASIPNSSLLIALPTPAPCRRSALSADLTTSRVLEIHIVAGASDCASGGNMLAEPVFWLLAVPRDALPSRTLSVVIDERAQGIGVSSASLGEWRTTVDLRRPIQSSDGAVSAADLQSAIDAALADARKRGIYANRILEIGLFRWSSGAGSCETTGSAINENWGAFVVIATNSMALEYHTLGGATVFCRNESI